MPTSDASFIKIDKTNYIQGEVQIRNDGNRNTFLNFNNIIFTATEILNSQHVRDCFGGLFEGYVAYNEYVIRAGNQINVPFLIKVNSCNDFLIDFWIPVPKKDQDIYSELGVYKKVDETYWGAQKIIKKENS
jgi:hypothetical protein